MKVYTGNNEEPYQFSKCGAVHRACWMAKQLHCYKIVLLQNHLPSRIVSKYQIVKTEKFVDFCTFVFNEWWFSCPLAASAPLQNLKLATNIQSYAPIDKIISDAALKALNRHAWYLTGELISLALWDNKLAIKKETLAKSLLSLSSPSDNQQLLKRFGTGFRKPVLPETTGQETLSDFINDDSMQMFHMLKISNSFLDKSSGGMGARRCLP